MPIMGMAIDLVAPSLPAISSSLQVSAQVAKNVISMYLLGYALGNFFAGFLSDAWGRQKILRVNLLAFVVASLLPVIFPRIEILLMARLLQGITLGAVAVVSRAICSDILEPAKLLRLGPLLGAMWGLGPIVGPIIGGYLQYYFNWQAGFIFFAIIASLASIAVWLIIPETHLQRQPLQILTIKNNFREILSHRFFMGLVFIMGLAYALIIGFNTLGPFLIQRQLHYSPVFFGHIAFGLGWCFLIATFICRHLLKTYTAEVIYFWIISLFTTVSILGLILSYFFSSSIILITLVSALMFFAAGFIFPLSMGKGLSLFRHIAGSASATMYLINILITSLVAFLISFIQIRSAVSLMWIYVGLLSVCSLLYWRMLRKKPI